MSVYSGFATRSQETAYNKTLYNMICLLQYKITKQYNQGINPYLNIEFFDEDKFSEYFKRFYQKLFELDEVKHLSPRFSYAVKELASHLGVFRELPNLATSPSLLSYRTEFNSTLPKPKINTKPTERVLRKLNNTVCITTPKNYLKDLYKFNVDNPKYKNIYKITKVSSTKCPRYKANSQTHNKPLNESEDKKRDIIFQSLIRNPVKPTLKQVRAKTVVRPRGGASTTNRMVKMIINNYGQKLSTRKDKKSTELCYPNRRFNSIDH